MDNYILGESFIMDEEDDFSSDNDILDGIVTFIKVLISIIGGACIIAGVAGVFSAVFLCQYTVGSILCTVFSILALLIGGMCIGFRLLIEKDGEEYEKTN